MAVLDILRMGHPLLRQMAAPLSQQQIESPEVAKLIEDMIDTLRDAGGVGLAAPQINQSLQLAIIEITEIPGRYGDTPSLPLSVYINPTIKVLGDQEQGFWEGCLSIPGLRGFVERPQHIEVSYLDRLGHQTSIELKGFLATVFQHEFDHLLGKLYVDRMKDMSQLTFEEEFEQFQLNDEKLD